MQQQWGGREGLSGSCGCYSASWVFVQVLLNLLFLGSSSCLPVTLNVPCCTKLIKICIFVTNSSWLIQLVPNLVNESIYQCRRKSWSCHYLCNWVCVWKVFSKMFWLCGIFIPRVVSHGTLLCFRYSLVDSYMQRRAEGQTVLLTQACPSSCLAPWPSIGLAGRGSGFCSPYHPTPWLFSGPWRLVAFELYTKSVGR